MKYKEYLKLIMAAAAGMIVLVSLLGSIVIPLSGLELSLRPQIFSQGYTQVAVPPFGLVRARTHLPPLQFKVTLENINLDLLQEAIPKLADQEIIEELQKEIRSFLYFFFLRTMAVGFLGGSVGAYILGIKERKKVIMAGVTGLLIISLFIGAAVYSYDINAFTKPEFEGVLSAAPWMVGLIEESIVKVNTLGKQMELLATNIFNVFERIERIEPLGTVDGDLKILHVSDIHNNPAGIRFINQVVKTFEVDAVIDTGDITDFGTPLETELIAQVAEFEVPYVFIPGNHDSPEVIDRMEEIEQVIILEEGKINLFGVVIAGIADPASQSPEMTVASQGALREYAGRLREVVETGDISPHITAAHNFGIVQDFAGEYPVILHGHTHSFNIREDKDTVIIDAGTSGAAGIRGLQSRREVPFSVVLLYFNLQGETPRLTAADIIKVFQLQSGFSLERVVF